MDSKLWDDSIKYHSIISNELEDYKVIEEVLLKIFKKFNDEDYGIGYDERSIITVASKDYRKGDDLFEKRLPKVLEIMVKNKIIECNDIDSKQKYYRLRNNYKHKITCSRCNMDSKVEIPLKDKENNLGGTCPNCDPNFL